MIPQDELLHVQNSRNSIICTSMICTSIICTSIICISIICTSIFCISILRSSVIQHYFQSDHILRHNWHYEPLSKPPQSDNLFNPTCCAFFMECWITKAPLYCTHKNTVHRPSTVDVCLRRLLVGAPQVPGVEAAQLCSGGLVFVHCLSERKRLLVGSVCAHVYRVEGENTVEPLLKGSPNKLSL